MSDIYGLISKISGEAGALAPEKSGGVPFAFRGVDSTINHLSPFLRANGVIVTPEVLEHVVTSRDVGTKTVTQSQVTTAFRFIAVSDGSEHIVTTVGLAQDYADRSAAQAQSVAFRVALLQTFALPTQQKEPEEAGEDVIRTTAEEKAKTATAPKVAAGPTVAELQAKVKAVISNPESAYTSDSINALGNRIANSDKPATWMGKADVLKKLLAAVEAGEVA